MANANLHSNSSIFNNKGYKETQTMNDTDEKIDEILVDSVGMDFCENDECPHCKQ